MPHGGMGPKGSHMPGEKAKDLKGTIKKLGKYLSVYKVALVL